MNPGDQAPPGTLRTDENICPKCGGSDIRDDSARCEHCGGTGNIIVSVGGA